MHSSPIDIVMRTLEGTKSVIVGETSIASALDFAARVLEGVLASQLDALRYILQVDLVPPYYSLVLTAVNLDPVLYDSVSFVISYIHVIFTGGTIVCMIRIYDIAISRRSTR